MNSKGKKRNKKKSIQSATKEKKGGEAGLTERQLEATKEERRFVTPEAEVHGWSCFGGH